MELKPGSPTITVAQLIEELKRFPINFEVYPDAGGICVASTPSARMRMPMAYNADGDLGRGSVTHYFPIRFYEKKAEGV